MAFVCLNGNIFPAEQPLLSVQNRGFRYGDGVFETIKVKNGRICLYSLHFERLFSSLKVLRINYSAQLNPDNLSACILQLCSLNTCLDLARVRLAVFRNEDGTAGFVIEASPLAEAYEQWNDTGYSIDIFPHARKSCDGFSHIKSANYLPFVMADFYAKEKGVDESIVLNTEKKICEASKANIFLVKNSVIYTPSLQQGCVDGVMRKFVVQSLKSMKMEVSQTTVTEEMLLEADEVFLTNALIGMRWVQSFRNRQYSNNLSRQIFSSIFK